MSLQYEMMVGIPAIFHTRLVDKYLPQFFWFSLRFFGLCEYILIHWEGIESLYFLEILHYGSEKRERE